MAVNSGYCLSFVKNHIEQLCKVKISNKVSQFRSRDFYLYAVTEVLRNNKKIIGEAMDLDLIPNLSSNKLAFVDGYGNLKTTIGKKRLISPGQKVKILLIRKNN